MSLRRILVPLDGSARSEAILPVVEALARCFGSVLLLVHTLEADPPDAVHGEPHITSADAAQRYLECQRTRVEALGLRAEARVGTAERDVASAIEELAREMHADLIATCMHGRRSLRDRLLGPIGLRVLRDGTANVLVRTAGSEADEPFDVHRVLVPIDFRHELDPVVDVIDALGCGFDLAVTLLHVVEPAGSVRRRWLPGASTMMRTLDRERTRGRLAALRSRLRSSGIGSEIVVREGFADDVIVEEAWLLGADLIVLATHSRTGIPAWYERSIGGRLLEEERLTLLLLRQPSHGDGNGCRRQRPPSEQGSRQ